MLSTLFKKLNRNTRKECVGGNRREMIKGRTIVKRRMCEKKSGRMLLDRLVIKVACRRLCLTKGNSVGRPLLFLSPHQKVHYRNRAKCRHPHPLDTTPGPSVNRSYPRSNKKFPLTYPFVFSHRFHGTVFFHGLFPRKYFSTHSNYSLEQTLSVAYSILLGIFLLVQRLDATLSTPVIKLIRWIIKRSTSGANIVKNLQRASGNNWLLRHINKTSWYYLHLASLVIVKIFSTTCFICWANNFFEIGLAVVKWSRASRRRSARRILSSFRPIV